MFADEPERMNAVHRYDVLDIPREASFDRITALAARLLDAPVALISVVDHDRIFFLSHHGLDFDEIDRNDSLCAIAMAEAEPWIIRDAVDDDRSASSSWVTGDFGMRFYVEHPAAVGGRVQHRRAVRPGLPPARGHRRPDRVSSGPGRARHERTRTALESRRPKSEILAQAGARRDRPALDGDPALARRSGLRE